jgi:putative membrane protein
MSDARLGPIRQVQLSDRAYEEIEAAIVRCELPPGELVTDPCPSVATSSNHPRTSVTPNPDATIESTRTVIPWIESMKVSPGDQIPPRFGSPLRRSTTYGRTPSTSWSTRSWVGSPGERPGWDRSPRKPHDRGPSHQRIRSCWPTLITFGSARLFARQVRAATGLTPTALRESVPPEEFVALITALAAIPSLILLAWLHLLALGVGMWAVLARAEALRQVAGGQAGIEALRRAFRADNHWAAAAALWLVTGLWRYLGSTEKSMAYYNANHVFLTKMALFVIVLALEIRPMVTLIRSRRALARHGAGGAAIVALLDPAGARKIATISYIQGAIVTIMILTAVAMARGYGAPD